MKEQRVTFSTSALTFESATTVSSGLTSLSTVSDSLLQSGQALNDLANASCTSLTHYGTS
jgi:hypothetical protein